VFGNDIKEKLVTRFLPGEHGSNIIVDMMFLQEKEQAWWECWVPVCMEERQKISLWRFQQSYTSPH